MVFKTFCASPLKFISFNQCDWPFWNSFYWNFPNYILPLFAGMRSTASWPGCGCNLQAGINQSTSAGAIVVWAIELQCNGSHSFLFFGFMPKQFPCRMRHVATGGPARLGPARSSTVSSAEFPETLKCVAFIIEIFVACESPRSSRQKFMMNSFSFRFATKSSCGSNHEPRPLPREPVWAVRQHGINQMTLLCKRCQILDQFSRFRRAFKIQLTHI